MFETSVNTLRLQGRERAAGPDSRVHDASELAEEIKRHFRDNYPILLDGALTQGADSGHFIRQARESLFRSPADRNRMPAALLREALEAVAGRARPSTQAGLTAVGPRRARVWWDDALLNAPADVLAGLDKPRTVLRFYDITGLGPDAGSWNETFDIDVALEDRGKSVDFWASDRVYRVELGCLHADGRFLRLAGTNTVELPRDARGDGADSGTARSNLRPRGARVDAVLPDTRAREWVEARPDHATRDAEAELIVHMLYRSFLEEGPRALRRAPPLHRRDAEVLRREFVQRGRSRVRRAQAARKAVPAAPAILVARLDSPRRDSRPGLSYPPVPLALVRSVLPETLFDTSVAPASLPAVVKNDTLVTSLPADAEVALSLFASPVFEAAKSLRERLAGMHPLRTGISEALVKAASAGEAELKKRRDRPKDFGGSESRRFAKAGVRFTRMALTLEGRMRPGARLKVAGKLVYADADGCFRLECVLSGKKASIPMRAGTSIGGEARGQINVEWEKLASREKKKVF